MRNHLPTSDLPSKYIRYVEYSTLDQSTVLTLRRTSHFITLLRVIAKPRTDIEGTTRETKKSLIEQR